MKSFKRVLVVKREKRISRPSPKDIAMARVKALFNEASEEELKMIEVVDYTKTTKKKIIIKRPPINYISEKFNNGVEIRYYNYSGHCMLYKDGKLVQFISNNDSFDLEFFNNIVPWLSYKDTTNDAESRCVFKSSLPNENFFQEMYDSIRKCKNKKLINNESRTIVIRRWKSGEKHAVMPKR